MRRVSCRSFPKGCSLSQDAEHNSAHATPLGDSYGHDARTLVEEACVQWQVDLTAFLLGVLKSRHLAEDAFQMMVIKAIEAAESARPETLRGWLFRIALNEARQLQRERQRDALHQERIAERFSSHDISLVVESGLLRVDVVSAIRISLQKLPVEQQDVIRRRIYEDQTFAEIAAQMKQPLGTVLTWMRRGLLKLKADVGLQSLVDDDTV